MTTQETCEHYEHDGDGWCGSCPTCADKTEANRERMDHARQTLDAYAEITDIGEDDATTLCDFLTDCMHLLGREVVEGRVRMAAQHYEAEARGEE